MMIPNRMKKHILLMPYKLANKLMHHFIIYLKSLKLKVQRKIRKKKRKVIKRSKSKTVKRSQNSQKNLKLENGPNKGHKESL